MRRTTAVACATLAACVALGSNVALPGVAAANATPAPKDPCAAKTSKWARLQCENYSHSAPGDEYFGKMKMSYLGINNTFHDATIMAGDYTTSSTIINKVSLADDALRAWAQKYPGDPELARSYFLAITAFKKIYIQQYQEEAWTYMNALTSRFGSTYFGKLERADLKRGFTEHYFALPQMCPTPLPSGVTIPLTPGPAPTDTPTPRPGQPKVELITPPCVQPSIAPTDEPMLSPSPSPTP